MLNSDARAKITTSGVWDLLSPEKAVNLARELFTCEQDAQKVSEQLISVAKMSACGDVTVSLVIVRFSSLGAENTGMQMSKKAPVVRKTFSFGLPKKKHKVFA